MGQFSSASLNSPRKRAHPYTKIMISGMKAFRVPRGDLNNSDPYLKFTLLMDGPEYDGTGPFGGPGGPTAQTKPSIQPMSERL